MVGPGVKSFGEKGGGVIYVSASKIYTDLKYERHMISTRVQFITHSLIVRMLWKVKVASADMLFCGIYQNIVPSMHDFVRQTFDLFWNRHDGMYTVRLRLVKTFRLFQCMQFTWLFSSSSYEDA